MPQIILVALLLPRGEEVNCILIAGPRAPDYLLAQILGGIGAAADLQMTWAGRHGTDETFALSLTVSRAAYDLASKGFAADDEIEKAQTSGVLLMVRHAARRSRKRNVGACR